MENAKQLNPASLAFVGDAVYELLVRERLCEISRPSKELHSLSVRFVSAAAQVQGFRVIEPLLTEEEIEIFKRGRNFHTKSFPKSVSVQEYRIATGLEVLFGYLHVTNNEKRYRELFEKAFCEINC
jgi:ribonuclease-3 family protein